MFPLLLPLRFLDSSRTPARHPIPFFCGANEIARRDSQPSFVGLTSSLCFRNTTRFFRPRWNFYELNSKLRLPMPSIVQAPFVSSGLVNYSPTTYSTNVPLRSRGARIEIEEEEEEEEEKQNVGRRESLRVSSSIFKSFLRSYYYLVFARTDDQKVFQFPRFQFPIVGIFARERDI